MMRRGLFCAALLLVAGCENGEVANPLAPVGELAGMLRGAPQAATPETTRLARTALSALKEPVGLAVVSDIGAAAILVPLGVNPRAAGGPVTTWTTQGRQTLAFGPDGRVIATRGLGDDLMATARRADGARMHYGIDSANGRLDHVLICRRSGVSVETVTLASGERLALRRETETCTTDAGARVTNEFWRDRDGRARKSRQWINPGLGYLDWETLRPE